MDDRFRFLYPGAAELRGRMRRARAGNGETGASGAGPREGSPPAAGPRPRRGAS